MDKRWDTYFMRLARVTALQSKDPRTKVGTTVVRDRHVLSHGFNGIPAGVQDLPERMQPPEKYNWMLHAELNAVANSQGPVRGATLYTTLPCCTPCTLLLIQFGIREIVVDLDGLRYLAGREWHKNDWFHPDKREISLAAMREAGVRYRHLHIADE